MVFTIILNPSFIDMTFKVKQLMVRHALDGDWFKKIDISSFVYSNLDGSNDLLLLTNFYVPIS